MCQASMTHVYIYLAPTLAVWLLSADQLAKTGDSPLSLPHPETPIHDRGDARWMLIRRIRKNVLVGWQGLP
jgi:hypothetical protein